MSVAEAAEVGFFTFTYSADLKTTKLIIIKVIIKVQTMFLIRFLITLITSGSISGSISGIYGLNLPPVSLNFDDTLANILKPHISCTLTEQFLTAEYLMKVSGTLNTQHTLINDLRDNIPNDNIPNDNTSNNMDNENMDNENMDNENMDNDKESHLIQLQEEYDKINQLRYEHTTQRTLSQRTLSPQ